MPYVGQERVISSKKVEDHVHLGNLARQIFLKKLGKLNCSMLDGSCAWAKLEASCVQCQLGDQVNENIYCLFWIDNNKQ